MPQSFLVMENSNVNCSNGVGKKINFIEFMFTCTCTRRVVGEGETMWWVASAVIAHESCLLCVLYNVCADWAWVIR